MYSVSPFKCVVQPFTAVVPQILDLVKEVFNRGGCEELGVPVRDPVFPE